MTGHNDSKRAYKLMKELASEKKGRSSTIHDKSNRRTRDSQKMDKILFMRVAVTMQFWTSAVNSQKLAETPKLMF